MDWLNSFSRQPSIGIGGKDIPITIKRHPTAKRLTMRIAPDGGEIRITMPRWAQSREAVAFAASRKSWLEQQLNLVQLAETPYPGSDIPFRGDMLTLRWDAALPRKPHIEGSGLHLGGPEETIAIRAERWLRAEATSIMERDLADYCAAANVLTPPLSLSRAQRRWGSCSSTGTVRINWRLIMAPDFVRRSVVAHETAHLVHFDHSRAFHALLGTIFEGNIDHANAWLKTHGRSLYRHFG